MGNPGVTGASQKAAAHDVVPRYMDEDPYADRRSLTFAQAEGAEPLPQQLQLRVISDEMRALLWWAVVDTLSRSKGTPGIVGGPHIQGGWRNVLCDFWALHLHCLDDFNTEFCSVRKIVREIIENGDYVRVFGFLQFVLRHPSCPFDFDRIIEDALRRSRAAYRVLDKNTIIPIGSEEEAETLQRALVDLAEAEFRGARSHLRAAGSHLTAGDNAASVRESIHSVESVARVLEPSGDLSKALAELEKSSGIHGALKRGFASIYGYASDEEGVRHPLLDDARAGVDEADALFMMGACAAFVSYMINKARLAGLLDGKGAAS